MAAGKEDIAPELLKKVQEDYRKRCENDKELARIEALAENGKANGKDTDAYAVRAGELLAAALHDNVSGDVLPDGKMYFNIANRVLPPVLKDNYELVAGMSTRIQQVLNDNAGLHMKALRPDLNEDRVKGLVNLAASANQYEDKRKELEADVVNFSQRISADGFHKNAEFQYTSGFNPKIRREAEAGCCKWCQALEGTYDYADVRDTGNDVWRRHRDCKCIVEYDPGDGRRQNAHTKTWSQADDHRKKIEDAERMMEERIKINEQNKEDKKAAEQSRRNPGDNTSTVISPKIETKEYEDKMKLLGENDKVTAIMVHQARTSLYHRNGTLQEDMVYINPETNIFLVQRSYNKDSECLPTKKMIQMVTDNPGEIIAMHNHPRNMLPSYKDLLSAQNYKYGIILCHNGDIIKYKVNEDANLEYADIVLNNMQDDYYDIEKRNSHIKILKDAGVILEVFS